MTHKFIEQKAAGLDFNKWHQYSDTFEKFGKHYCVSFAISKYDDVSVFQVGRALYELIAGEDEVPNYAMESTTILNHPQNLFAGEKSVAASRLFGYRFLIRGLAESLYF